ncbi:MAG: hypothetical protein IKN56_09440 [Clostridia bacterium]|nr:hypothetical protein [Clostridia bacterium]MBR6361180.1 hypothetical protein [Clostridia bacterium]
MKNLKRILSLILAAITALGIFCIAYADDEPAVDPSTEAAAIDYLDTSAVDGKIYAYKGIETYFVVYPFPEESESRFDIYKAQITCSDDSVIDCKPNKGEQARFGSVLIKGKKLGKANITVTEPESGKTCEVEVIVIPSLGYHIKNFFMSLEYVPFFLFMRIAALLSRLGLIQ